MGVRVHQARNHQSALYVQHITLRFEWGSDSGMV